MDIGNRVVDYIRNIYVRVGVVVGLSVIVPFIVYESMDDTLLRFFAVCLVCMLSVGTVAYTVGLTSHERVFVKSNAVALFNKIFHR